MQETCTYDIEVAGQVQETALNAGSPLRVNVVQAAPAATRFTVCADQSGLIGLLRYLHQEGFVLISIQRAKSLKDHDKEERS